MSEWFEDWPLRPLGDLAADEPNAITDGPFGSNLKSADYVEAGPVRVIRLGNIKVGDFDETDTAFVSEEKFASLRKHEAKPGDLVIAALAEPVGRAAIVPQSIGPAIVKADCIRLRLGREVEPRFLLHALNSPIGLKQTEEAAHGIGRLRVNLGEVRQLQVPVPPLDEQRRIVAKLDALRGRSRRAKEALDAVPALVDRLRQSILAAAFRGDLTADWREQNPDVEPASELLKRIRIERRKRWEEAELAKLIAKGKAPKDDRWKAKYVEPEPVDESELPELPEGWCWASVEEVAAPDPRAIQSGPFGSNLLHSEFQSTGMLAIGIDNVLDGAFSLGAQHRISEKKFDELRQYAARPGDVLITVMATIGRCCLVPEGTEPAIITKHVYRVTPNRTAIAPGFLMHAIRGAPAVRAAIADDARGQTRLGLNGAIIKALPVPLASRGEQDAVLAALAVSLGDAQGVAIAVEDADAALRTLDRSILDAAFRGEFLDRQSDASSTDS